MPARGGTKPPAWLPPAKDVGDLDDEPEAILEGPEEFIAALKGEQVRRGLGGAKYQSTETGYEIVSLLLGHHKTYDEDSWAFLRLATHQSLARAKGLRRAGLHTAKGATYVA